MSPATAKKNANASDRVAILQAIRNPLHFFVLVVLVVEVVLGGLAARTEGPNQLVALCGMLFIILALITVVAFLARKPGALQGENAAASRAQEFCSRISGYWWSKITSAETASLLGIVEIRPDPVLAAVWIKGSGYSRDGIPGAEWESTASCTDANSKKVFYRWRGWHPSSPNKQQYEGFGEISFDDSLGTGHGLYLELSVTAVRRTTRKSSRFVRCTKQEVQVIGRPNDRERISDLIRTKVTQL